MVDKYDGDYWENDPEYYDNLPKDITVIIKGKKKDLKLDKLEKYFIEIGLKYVDLFSMELSNLISIDENFEDERLLTVKK